jgi:hypothetical protein
MTEALLLLSAGSLLTICIATLIIATLALRHARRYVELAEERMEHLREEQARLLTLLREERQRSHEEPEQEWERLPETRREHERREQEHIARRDAERKIDQVKRELLGLPQEQQESTSPVPEGSPEDMARARGRLMEKAWPTQKAPRAGTSRTETSSKLAEGSPEDKKLPLARHSLAVWHPHPDDDVNPGSASTGQAAAQSDAPLKMFHRYYDRYLDNYEGYVKLAQRLYLMREKGEVPPGSAAEQEWEEKLRRANDGIERTTARLDLLEEYNPELATDDRVSRRASIARSDSKLGRSRRLVEEIEGHAIKGPVSS